MMLLESIRRVLELRRKMDEMQAEYEKKKRKKMVYKLAPREIEETLGAHVKLPPRNEWQIEPFEEKVCTRNDGWVDVFLRVKIDDLELFAGSSFRGDLAFLVRGQCRNCQEYLYYSVSLSCLDDLMHRLEMAQLDFHNCLKGPSPIKRRLV
jgi:hypothetical protein